jgi:hypothetical protein
VPVITTSDGVEIFSGGVPIEVFGGLREGSLQDRSQLYMDLAAGPFLVRRAAHGVTDTHKDRLNQDLLAFLQG